MKPLLLILFTTVFGYQVFAQNPGYLKVRCSEQVYHVPSVFLEGLNLKQTNCIESIGGKVVLHSPSIPRRQIEKVRVLNYQVSRNSPLLAWSVAGEVSNVTYPGIFTDNCGEYLLGVRLLGSENMNNLQLALFFETPKVVMINFTRQGRLYKRGRLAYYGGDPDAMRTCEGYETSYGSPKDQIIDVSGRNPFIYFLNFNLQKGGRQEMTKIKY